VADAGFETDKVIDMQMIIWAMQPDIECIEDFSKTPE
jgi:hypothetical protein